MYHPHQLQCLPPALSRTVGYTLRKVAPSVPTEAELERQARDEGHAIRVIQAYVVRRKGRRQV